MLKKLVLGLSALTFGVTANAALVIDQSVITGADMAGMEVTAFFGDGSSETLNWSVMSTDASVAFGEGFSGGVMGAGWSLTQQGYSLGNVNPDDGSVLGLWTLTNSSVSSSIIGFDIAALAGLIAFDVDFENEVTPYSELGRSFVTPANNTLSEHSSQIDPAYNDLFGALSVMFDLPSGLAAGEELVFLADTDKLKVPEPSSAAIVLLGLLLGARRLRHSQ